MATIGIIAITLDHLCAAENHAHLTLDLNSGEKIRQQMFTVNDLINAPLDENDIEGFRKVLMKLGSRGKSKAQMKTLLEAGVIITIDASAAP